MVRRASYEKPKDGPQSARQVSGTFPGVLDPTQPSRILQTQASILSFASYEPRAATSEQIPDFGNLSLNDDHSERCRSKRIVIETVPGRGNFWRFVPNAVREQYVEDEGAFPRLIRICGLVCQLTIAIELMVFIVNYANALKSNGIFTSWILDMNVA